MTIKYLTNLDLAGNQITNLGAPVQANDVATKLYVYSVAQGLDVKASVKAASTANLTTLSGAQNVGGVSLTTGDRVLLKNQTTATENGIYDVKAGAWTKASDADGSNLTLGAFTFVEGGDNAGKGFVYNSTNTWTQFSESTVLSAGTGITVDGSTISISTSYAGQTSINTVGTITNGTWSGSVIGVAKGGTGATTLTGYVKGNAADAFTASTTIPVTDITGRKLVGNITAATGTNTYTINTSTLDGALNDDAIVQLRDSDNNVVFADIKIKTNSEIDITVVNNDISSITLKYVVLV